MMNSTLFSDPFVCRLFGVFGDPVNHSLSPLMHNTAFRKLGINGIYLPFHVQANALPQAVEAIRALGMAGVNVTVPHKLSVTKFIDELEGDAVLTGSVNTIHNNNGRLIGHSTDGLGLMRSLVEEVDWSPRGESAIILGTGGAAAAIAYRLVQEGISRLLILTRSESKGVELADAIHGKMGFRPETASFNYPELARLARRFTLVINATPLGMLSHNGEAEPPFAPEWIAPDGICCDLIYNPLETAWLRRAKIQGRRTLSGLGMLVHQGAESFKIWTGQEMPTADVRESLTEQLLMRDNLQFGKKQ